MVTADVVLLQVVVVLVKVKVTLPAATPVATPALVTVAREGLLLTHVPPLVGLNVIVDPIHKLDDGTLTVGSALIVTADVALLQVVAVLVNVKVTLPAATPVTTPAFVTVAREGLLLTHVPPLIGLNVIAEPIHKLDDGTLTVGSALIVTADVVLLQVVVVLVNVKVTLPAATPVTTPALVTVATEGLLLTQVPPLVGLNVIADPTHKLEDGTLTVGSALIVTADVVLLQVVVVLVNVNVTLPAATPVATPALVTVAREGLLLTQVPPLIGLNVIAEPIHKLDDGTLTVGSALIVTADVVLLQVVVVLVNVNVTLPAATPVSTPALVPMAIQ